MSFDRFIAILFPYSKLSLTEKKAFADWAMLENIRRLKLFGWVGSGINIFIIFAGMNAYGAEEVSTLESRLRLMWIAASFIYIFAVGRPRHPEEIKPWRAGLFFFAAALSLLFSMLITVTYSADKGYTFLFIINVLLTCTFLYFTFVQVLAVIFPSFFVFIVALSSETLGANLPLENVINIIAVGIFALAVSQMNLYSELSKFRFKQIIEKQNEELRNMAEIDELTGIANRRKINQYFAFIRDYVQREKLALSVIMLDIDFFKLYNDTYGHPVGDRCLQQIVHCIEQVIRRRTDFLGRYGGEEFLIILPGAGSEDAMQIAEQIRQVVYDASIANEKAPLGQVTVSLGVASHHPEMGEAAEMLIAQADSAMYAAKSSGRNCCRLFSAPALKTD